MSTEYLGNPDDEEEVGRAAREGEVGGSRAELRDIGECIKSGHLWKTSCGRSKGSKPGPTRTRRFRLTEEALEYFQQFSHVSCHRNRLITRSSHSTAKLRVKLFVTFSKVRLNVVALFLGLLPAFQCLVLKNLSLFSRAMLKKFGEAWGRGYNVCLMFV